MWIRLYFKHLFNSVKRKPLQPLLSVLIIFFAMLVSCYALNIYDWIVESNQKKNEAKYGQADYMITLNANSKTRFLREKDVYEVIPQGAEVVGKLEFPMYINVDTLAIAAAVDLEKIDDVFDFKFISYGDVRQNNVEEVLFVTEELALQAGISIGDRISAEIFGAQTSLVVQGITKTPLLGDYDAVMSVYSATELLSAHSPILALFTENTALYSTLFVKIDSEKSDVETVGKLLATQPSLADKTVSVVDFETTMSESFSILKALTYLLIAFVTVLPTIINYSCFYILSNQRSTQNALFIHQGVRPRQMLGLQIGEIFVYWLISVILSVPVVLVTAPLTLSAIGITNISFSITTAFIVNVIISAVITLISAAATSVIFALSERAKGKKRTLRKLAENYRSSNIASVVIAAALVAAEIPLALVSPRDRSVFGVVALVLTVALFFMATPSIVCNLTALLSKKTPEKVSRSLVAAQYAIKNVRSFKGYHNITRLIVMILAVNVLLALTFGGMGSMPDEISNIILSDQIALNTSGEVEYAVKNSPAVKSASGLYYATAYDDNNESYKIMSCEDPSFLGESIRPQKMPVGNEIVISEVYSEYFGLDIGDEFVLKIDGKPYTFVVSEIRAAKYNMIVFDAAGTGVGNNAVAFDLKEGATLQDVRKDISETTVLQSSVITSIYAFNNTVYKNMAIYIVGAKYLCLAILLFSIIGFLNAWFDNDRMMDGDHELYFTVGLTRKDILRMKLTGSATILGISIVLSAIMLLVLVMTLNWWMVAYFGDYLLMVFG